MGYVPFYVLDGCAQDAQLTFLQPVQVPAGESDLKIKMIEGGRIDQLTLHAAIAGVNATAVFGGEQHVYFPGESPAASITFTGPAGAHLAGRAVIQQLRLADAWGRIGVER